MVYMTRDLKAISASENHPSWRAFRRGTTRQTSGSGCTPIPATVADCLSSRLTSDADALPVLAAFSRQATLAPTQLSFSGGSSLAAFCLHQATISRKQDGKREAGCHGTAEDATMSSSMTSPGWYAGRVHHNCFQSTLIHASRWSVFSSCAHGVHVVRLQILVIGSNFSRLNTFKHECYHTNKRIFKSCYTEYSKLGCLLCSA